MIKNSNNSNIKIMSGMQTSGKLHLGNYIGAVQNWKELSFEVSKNFTNSECFFMLADLHSLTSKVNKAELEKNRIDCLISYIACGILNFNKKTNIYFQSEIHEIPYLCWILSNFTKIGELFRMTQFKDKKGKENEENINSGLLFYPILMAADILILNPNFVPVGEDQRQHLELARNIAESFNREIADDSFKFNIPKEIILQNGKRIMSLRYPEKKMSKSSSSEMEIIYLEDSNDKIIKKIKSATTDSIKGIYFDKESRPGVSNLIEIFSCLSGKNTMELKDFYSQKDTKTFKEDLANIIIEKISPIREEIFKLEKDKQEVLKIAKKGHENVSIVAEENLDKIKKSIGIF